ncbi:hypothetical protein BT96DRAFT_881096 [Gymnopus androsaceus JB14]|uniref:Uncharacterized protein n=1 Tax=Gymnopus androsaceus JB14 TaxID=1447944 RepID=A0A6A4HSM4_9AGAR|nr:hypothetical protein BT96DRAFT_881096 [Gymnopus androsaceus JB14]
MYSLSNEYNFCSEFRTALVTLSFLFASFQCLFHRAAHIPVSDVKMVDMLIVIEVHPSKVTVTLKSFCVVRLL